jgi:hypothetical protein
MMRKPKPICSVNEVLGRRADRSYIGSLGTAVHACREPLAQFRLLSGGDGCLACVISYGGNGKVYHVEHYMRFPPEISHGFSH